MVPNGVEPHFFTIERRLPQSPPRFLFLGTWIARKGTEELAAAVRSHPELRVTVAGAGSDNPGLAVEWTPHVQRESLPALLGEHDVLVLPSLFEGMPLAALEAAAAGMAVIGTDIGGTVDIFGDDGAGGAVIIQPGDGNALAAAMIDLHWNPHRIATLQLTARDTARRFTWRCSAELALQAYQYGASCRRDRRHERSGPRHSLDDEGKDDMK